LYNMKHLVMPVGPRTAACASTHTHGAQGTCASHTDYTRCVRGSRPAWRTAHTHNPNEHRLTPRRVRLRHCASAASLSDVGGVEGWSHEGTSRLEALRATLGAALDAVARHRAPRGPLGRSSREPASTRAYAVAVSVAVPDCLAVISSADMGLQVTTRQMVLRFSYRGRTMMVMPAVQPQQRAIEDQIW